MQRYRNNTVTTIPVLIPCAPAEKDGVATFDEHAGPVRELTNEDFDVRKGKHRKFLDAMSDDERQHFAGVVRFLDAIQERDPVALDKARKQLAELRQRQTTVAGEYPQQFGQLLAPYFGLAPDKGEEAIAIHEGRRQPESFAEDPAKELSLEISKKLTFWVRVVLWWTGKRFTPALYCMDPKVAPYVFVLTRKTWGVCPHCGFWFTKERSDQSYCSIAHREAHRVARWREGKKKGGKRGTRKAR